MTDNSINKLNELIPQMNRDQKLQAISEISNLYQTVDYEAGKDQEFVEIVSDLDDKSIAKSAIQSLVNSLDSRPNHPPGEAAMVTKSRIKPKGTVLSEFIAEGTAVKARYKTDHLEWMRDREP